uniref:NADH:ubiquinone reductase (H(+)-translocating) n=1 Tax=Mesabolivar sp. ITV1036I2 TaxID=2508675 RepID=A0A411FES2_9ARAC|nr:NADH dehydrogenase subunit 5 [Mesabolivar sp. ITV1036I2]
MLLMLPLLFSMLMMTTLSMMNSTTFYSSFTIINNSTLPIMLDVTYNWQTMLFTSTVMLISLMIMIYSKDYISSSMNQFMILMTLFVTSMITLILSNNTMFVILGWDGLGLTSYLLVMFYQNNSSSTAASITMLTNRVGDIIMMISMAMLIHSNTWNMNQNEKMNSLSMLLLMMASSTKSAQFPFTAWLPAAMAAPTPVSALVHSSTLVTAGVWLMFRLSNNIHPMTNKILLISAMLTSLTSSLSALTEMDLKKMIALSTLSQVAFMMMTISMKMFNLSMFHLITHALFKATMFMCVGYMINNSTYQDYRAIKSTPSSTKSINTTLGMSSMALSGIPFSTGFYSKDAILEQQNMIQPNSMLMLMTMMSVTITTSYNLKITMKALSWNNMKSPNTTNNSSTNMLKSITTMAPTTMITGTLLSWVTIPQMTPIITTPQKLCPLMTIMIGSSMLLMNTPQKLLTMIMSTMWNMNFISTSPTKMIKLGSNSLYLDNSWKESMFLMMNKNTNMFINAPLLTISMMTLLMPMMT